MTTVADLLLMPSLRPLPRRGVQSTLEQFIRGYNFDLFMRMGESLDTNGGEFRALLSECAGEALHEVRDIRSGQSDGLYRLLFQDDVVGFVRMRLRLDYRCPDRLLPLRRTAFHTDPVLADILATRLSRMLVITEDYPPLPPEARVDSFLTFGREDERQRALPEISDDRLRRLLGLNCPGT